jgi:hypothetical protein
MLYAEHHARLGLPFDENGAAAPTTSLPRRPRSGCATGIGLDPRADADLQSARAQAVHLVADVEATQVRP